MGLFILTGVLWLTWLASLFFVKKRTGNEVLIMPIGLLAMLVVALLTNQVFPQYGEPQLVDTVELYYTDQSGTVYVEEEKRGLTGSEVNVKITYELSFNPEETVYVFMDNQNRIYCINGEEVIIKTPKEVLERKGGETFPVEVIKGDYEKPYVEKYERRAPTTFLSMGGTKLQYKIYIPQNMTIIN